MGTVAIVSFPWTRLVYGVTWYKAGRITIVVCESTFPVFDWFFHFPKKIFHSHISFYSHPLLTFFCLKRSLERGNAVVVTEGDRFRDTAALTVRADGKDIPPFVIKGQVGSASYASGRRPKKGEKPVGGMNTSLMKKYVDHLVQYVEEPSILLLDRASCHTANLTKDYIAGFLTKDGRQLLHVEFLPPKAAFLLSPLDNGVNAAFKTHFYKYDRSTFELKKSAVKLAWDEVSNESILNICRGCGLDGNTSLQSLRRSFEKNVKGVIPENLEESVEVYDRWKSGNIEIDGADLHRGVEYSHPQQLNDGTLDGYKWIEWGE